jgi:hypothetical protein
MSIAEELDRAIGHGPGHRPIEERIAAGRRAVRRRRAVGAVASLAVVAALGGSAWALADGGTRTSGDVDPPIATTTPAAKPAPPAEKRWEDDTPIRYLGGELQIRPGVVVHQRIENPYGFQPPKLSVALDLTYQRQRQWILAEHSKNGFGYISSVPSNGWASFEAWVADQVDGSSGGEDGWPESMRLTDRGQIVAAPGSEVLQRTDDPQLGEAFAPPGTPTGAAVVRAGDGKSYFVVWRVIDGTLDVITTPPRDVVGATFAEMLTMARNAYAGGEGLR